MADLGTAHLGRPLQALGWTFGFDRARRRLGACHSRTRRITLSHALSTALSPADVEDTIRHEIAHALDVATRGRTCHDAVWKAWAVRCGAAPARCYSGALPTDAEAPYACLCPACGQADGRHREPIHALRCVACRTAGRTVYLRVMHRRTGRVVWEGGAIAGAYCGARGYTARCPGCGREARAARAPRRAQACGDCCRRHAGGRYDERFRLHFVKASGT
jgi:predicted SprT family Zn-dependent metalloprotease